MVGTLVVPEGAARPIKEDSNEVPEDSWPCRYCIHDADNGHQRKFRFGDGAVHDNSDTVWGIMELLAWL